MASNQWPQKERARERKIKTALPKVKTSAKSVQTTRVVCTNFSRSLYRLQLKFAEGYAQMNFSASLFIISVTQKYNYLESVGVICTPKVFYLTLGVHISKGLFSRGI